MGVVQIKRCESDLNYCMRNEIFRAICYVLVQNCVCTELEHSDILCLNYAVIALIDPCSQTLCRYM
jgi:hypothetical protein